MQNILKGIYNMYLNDADLKAALSGGLHFKRAPQGTIMPYGLYHLITGRKEYILNTEYYERPLIQFDLFALTNGETMTAYDALTALYDDARITATGYTPVIFENISYQSVMDGDQDQIHRIIVEYRGDWKKS